MQPLNTAERRNAFLNFLLLFLVTVAVIVTVIFFSIEVPFKQNSLLREQKRKMDHDKELADSFNVAMKEAMIELARFNSVKEPPDFTAERVQKKINKMNKMIKDRPDVDNSIYANVIQNLVDLNEAKRKLKKEEEKELAQNQ